MIIFINGSIHSGKSTVSTLLQKRLTKTAIVEIDALRACIDWMPLDQAIPLNLKNAVSVIRNFSQEGLNVIVPYPLSEKNYQFFLDELKDTDEKLVFITLAPRLEVVLQQRGERELTDWEKERIEYQYLVGIVNPRFGTIIDNSEQMPEQTVEEILHLL